MLLLGSLQLVPQQNQYTWHCRYIIFSGQRFFYSFFQEQLS